MKNELELQIAKLQKASRIVCGIFYIFMILTAITLCCIFIYIMVHILDSSRESLIGVVYLFIGMVSFMAVLIVTDVILLEIIEQKSKQLFGELEK